MSAPDGYVKVFEDDFSYTGAPDAANWVCSVGDKWANNEQQAYTDSPENVYADGECLHLISLKKDFGSKHYTSARVTSAGRKSWKYGYFEVEAKLPKGNGSWPAIWMLPDSIGREDPWPKCGEIDILEHIGRRQDELWFSLHSEVHNHTRKDTKQYTIIKHKDGVSDGFHTYALEWTKEHMLFLVDDEPFAEYRREDDPEHTGADGWPFDKPFYLILNIAVGGSLGGEIDENDLPYEMLIRSVRVFQKK